MKNITLTKLTKENNIYKGKIFLGVIEELFYNGRIAYNNSKNNTKLNFIDKKQGAEITSRVNINQNEVDIYLNKISNSNTISNEIIKFNIVKIDSIEKNNEGYIINCDKLFISENPALLKAIIEYRNQNKNSDKIINFEISVA